jgi:PTH1 family peptidyl-tRNA hydrolase
MKLVIGIGNSDVKYLETRHNVGFFVVEKLQKLKTPNVVVQKSNVFMNESGEFVSKLCTKYSTLSTDLYIIHDDLDIPLGEFKIQFGKGPKDHNGLKSINDKLGTGAYWHVRIGVDNRDPDNRTTGEKYVLENFQDGERKILDEVIKKACDKLISNFQISNSK